MGIPLKGKSMIIHIPMKLPSLANTRMHWRAMDRLKKSQKQIVRCHLPNDAVVVFPATVTLTRIGKRTLDSDNLAGAFKYVRDEIARYMGVDDGSPLYTWRYEQRKGEYGIEIKIEP